MTEQKIDLAVILVFDICLFLWK